MGRDVYTPGEIEPDEATPLYGQKSAAFYQNGLRDRRLDQGLVEPFVSVGGGTPYPYTPTSEAAYNGMGELLAWDMRNKRRGKTG